MMFGFGATATPAVTAPSTTAPAVPIAPTFTQGLNLWTTPSSALTAASTLISNPSVSFASAALPFTAGVLLPPVALIGILIFSMGGKK